MRNKIVFIILIAFLLLPGTLFAQRSTGGRRPTTVELSVVANVSKARVEVFQAGSGTAAFTGSSPFVQAMAKGSYTVTVSASGYESQTQSVNLQANQTLNFTLQAATVALRVTSNAPGALVKVMPANRSNVVASGNATFNANLERGNYQVEVSASGYITATQNVNMTRNQNININLQPALVALRVTSNVPTAQVQVLPARGSNVVASGNITFSANLEKGQYRVQVSASGYVTETRDVNMTRNQNVNINLRPATGTVNIIIPATILDLRKGNPASQVEVHIDGIQQEGNTAFQLRPGNHTVRISSGAFNVQRNLNIAAGQTYDFEIYMGISVNGE